jgi:asparagine synthase (glutamine-hydrolysing)
MKIVFGVFCRVADRLPQPVTDKILTAIQNGASGEYQFSEGCGIALMHTSESNPPASHNASGPCIFTSTNLIFIAVGRLDNVSELCSLLNISESERSASVDNDIMLRAYNAWGKECSARMYGDWVFAAWHPAQRQLVVSRSHYGCINLYYHIDQNLFAFASNRQTLLSLNLVPFELDELWLAQFIISWHTYYGERTPHKPIRCLPPAHYLVTTQSNYFTKRYWHPVGNTELQLSSRGEYVEAFSSIFEEAVRCRLRSDMPVAVSLSGGLDSSSVATAAARILAIKGESLKAFIAVPAFDTKKYLPTNLFGDEFFFAQATADYVGNIDLHPLTSYGISPVMGIRRALKEGAVPLHGAANLYWMLDVQQAAKAAGCRVLLTGAAGNGGFSWRGDPSSQSLSFLLSHFGWRTIVQILKERTKQNVRSALPNSVLASLRLHRIDQQEWYRQSAIVPDFARRLRLLEQRLSDFGEFPKSPREEQALTVMPGRAVMGAFNAEMAALIGLDIRDPTCDARMLDFVFSVPDRIFMDPITGIDRWLVREAMQGRLPDQVRLNRKRGRQNADIVPRLRGCAAEVENVLDELVRSPAAEYVDVEYMRRVWRMNQTHDTSEVRVAANQILLRGIMAGLFVNGFYESGTDDWKEA